ncbi:MAG TPA: sigma-54-dependent Fis family transcriptional regulator [Myxococcales bacterium]|nr:sigma-54-dependent Fis family transcriptional regulator [Myxococcales bacterium]
MSIQPGEREATESRTEPLASRSGEHGSEGGARRRATVVLAGAETVAVALRESAPLVVGRARPADVILADASLSRSHARLTWRDGVVEIEDLDSTNGVVVDDQPVRRASLREDSRVHLGGVELWVHPVGALSEGSAGVESRFERALRDELHRASLFQRPCLAFAVRVDGAGVARDWHRALGDALRSVDLVRGVARDVAVAVVAEAGAAETGLWAERLRSAVPGRRLKLGVACFPDDAAEPDALIDAALHALTHATPSTVGRPAPPAELDGGTGEVVLASPAIQRTYQLAGRVARTRMPVLVLGETGAGKELVAQWIHRASPRSHAPFKAINCATIPATLIESTLFGHEKGAFTGATARAAGVFEQAHEGTIFLDEIGELPAQAQAALLRVLETGRITRVGGGAKEIPTDVRVVAATHRDLQDMVGAASFRSDLLYRLETMTLQVPPLRDRLEDIPALAELFLARARSAWGTTVRGFGAGVMDALCAHDWPGNVRQLRNAVERASALAVGALIELHDLPPEIAGRVTEDEATLPDGPASLTDRVNAFERRLIHEALARADGNQSEAARLLRVPRRTLAHKVKRHGLA